MQMQVKCKSKNRKSIDTQAFLYFGTSVRVSPSPPKKSVLTEDGFFYIFIAHGAYNQIFAENPVSDRRIAAQSDENVLIKKTEYRPTSLKKRLASRLEV